VTADPSWNLAQRIEFEVDEFVKSEKLPTGVAPQVDALIALSWVVGRVLAKAEDPAAAREFFDSVLTQYLQKQHKGVSKWQTSKLQKPKSPLSSNPRARWSPFAFLCRRKPPISG